MSMLIISGHYMAVVLVATAALLCAIATEHTSVTDSLNKMMERNDKGVYTGGKGVIVRNPFDGLQNDPNRRVLPSTFWVNDIFSPSQFYPSSGGGNGDPMCPNNGNDGYMEEPLPKCPADPTTGYTGPWNYAQTGFVIGSEMHRLFTDFDNIQSPTWEWGVFYPADANSVDKRCRWLESDNGYDCPGGWVPWGGSFVKDGNTKDHKGAGYYTAGNPYKDPKAGGGAGCHFAGPQGFSRMGHFMGWIDQVNAWNKGGQNLVQNKDCECNYFFASGNKYEKTANGWDKWIDTALTTVRLKGHGAPSWAIDLTACWVNNFRDMINLQNQVYWKRDLWNNQMVPLSSWGKDPSSLRKFWGWNEIPVDHDAISNVENWDAIMIKLPAGICGHNGGDDSVNCMDGGAELRLEDDLAKWEHSGLLKSGLQHVHERPGSYVVFVREWADENMNWNRWFFCENWLSPRKWYKIVYFPPQDGNPTGACYIEFGDHTASNVTEIHV